MGVSFSRMGLSESQFVLQCLNLHWVLETFLHFKCARLWARAFHSVELGCLSQCLNLDEGARDLFFVKTHLEECTTRYLGFKCFLFSVYRVYPEVEDGRGTFDLACAFAVLFGVLEAWKCFADNWNSLVVFSLKRTCFSRFSGSCVFGEFVKEFHREDLANRTGLAQAWTVKSADRLFTW